MSLTACFLATLVVLPAFGLAAWAWWSLSRLIDDEGLLPGFEAEALQRNRYAAMH